MAVCSELAYLVEVLWFVINSACALDSGSTFFGPNALIMDGLTLSAAMHSRGINMRYLGRVVQLLIEKDTLTKEAASKITVIPNGSSPPQQNGHASSPVAGSVLNLPHYMTTIAIMELISRSAKHVFNPYIQVQGDVTTLLSAEAETFVKEIEF